MEQVNSGSQVARNDEVAQLSSLRDPGTLDLTAIARAAREYREPQHTFEPIPMPNFDYENFPGYYEYKPLPPGWIRLARCVTGDWNSTSNFEWSVRDLEIQLIQMPFHQAPRYDAISYTWGAATRLQAKLEAQQVFSTEPRIYPIRCDGRFARVTRSLREILYLMRRYDFDDAQTIFEANWGRPKAIWFCKYIPSPRI